MAMDLYCERIGPGFGAEPVNAWTNLAFLAAAWAAWRLARRREVGTGGLRTLLALCVSIGVGSGTFHIFATRWAVLLDVIPILLFQLAYIAVYVREIARGSRLVAGAILAAYLVVVWKMRQFPDVLNGSLMYLPALLFLVGLGGYHWRTRRAEPGILLAAAGVLIVSLAFRTIDETVCPAFPLGTHFLWHILNGVVLYLLLRALIVNLSSSPPDTM